MAESMVTNNTDKSKPSRSSTSSEVEDFNFAEMLFDKTKGNSRKKRGSKDKTASSPCDKKASATTTSQTRKSDPVDIDVTKNSQTSAKFDKLMSAPVTEELSFLKDADELSRPSFRSEMDNFKDEIRFMLSGIVSSQNNRKRRHSLSDGSKQSFSLQTSSNISNTGDSGDESDDNEPIMELTQTRFKIPKLSDKADNDVTAKIDEILDDLPAMAQENGGEDDLDFEESLVKDYVISTTVGKSVNEKIAPIIESLFSNPLPNEKLTGFIEKYPRPDNVKVFAPSVNYEVWRVLKPNTRVQDCKMAKTSEKLIKASYAIISTINELLVLKKSVPDKQKEFSSIVKTSLDGLTLLGSTALDLHQKRRDSFRHDSNLRYANLICCPSSNSDVGSSEYLFGADVVKKIKDIKDSTQNLSTNSGTSSKPGTTAGFNYSNHSSTYNSGFKGSSRYANKGKSFLGYNRRGPKRGGGPFSTYHSKSRQDKKKN